MTSHARICWDKIGGFCDLAVFSCFLPYVSALQATYSVIMGVFGLHDVA